MQWRHDGIDEILVQGGDFKPNQRLMAYDLALEAGEKFNVLATNKLDGAILATPALVGGNIYVRTESHLYAFGN